jgi:hypothetical protein
MSHCHTVVRRGSPIPASLRARLERHEEREVLNLTGMSQAAYWRARAGGCVNVGTMLRLEKALDALEGAHAAAE